jgi:hypothetical protein
MKNFLHIKNKERMGVLVRVVLLNATFNTISIVMWRPVLLVEETGENHTDKRYLIMMYQVLLAMSDIPTFNFSGDRHRLHT